jgi:diadenosine tetraphosphatase ApaH/serine/threonine PP2A family protein phosphatase
MRDGCRQMRESMFVCQEEMSATGRDQRHKQRSRWTDRAAWYLQQLIWQIRTIDRRQEVPHEGPMCDLLWSDPDGMPFHPVMMLVRPLREQ